MVALDHANQKLKQDPSTDSANHHIPIPNIAQSQFYVYAKASLNKNFIQNFIIVNIINFADMARRWKDEILLDVMRVLSP